MKLDYDFIKQILFALENNESHVMQLIDLWNVLKLDENPKNEDKLAGHIRLIEDNGYINFESKNSGFTYGINQMQINGNVKYRLTARGYEFLDILKNDTVFNKIKNLSLETAFDVGKSMLTTALTNLVQ